MTRFADRHVTCSASTPFGPCKAAAALGKVCWRHGAAEFRGPAALTLSRGRPVVFACDEQGKPVDKNAQPASKYAVELLIRRGDITWGRFVTNDKDQRANVEKLIRRLRGAGIRVEAVKTGLVQVYRLSAETSEVTT